MLQKVKLRCGIPSSITVYDEEIQDLIADALEEMRTAGVPDYLLIDDGDDTNPRVLTAVVLYVQAYRGSDRSDTSTYHSLFRRKLHKLMLEPTGEEGDDE